MLGVGYAIVFVVGYKTLTTTRVRMNMRKIFDNEKPPRFADLE